HPAEADQIDGQQGGQAAENEGADDSVSEGLALLRLGESENENSEDHRVVGAQQSLERHEHGDRDEVGSLNHASSEYILKLTRFVSSPIFGSAQGLRAEPMDVDQDLFFISMAARMLGMHPQTLRKYERLGLVQPSRTIGSMRLYSRGELERLKLIKRMVDDAGINLAGVQRLLSIAEVVQRL